MPAAKNRRIIALLVIGLCLCSVPAIAQSNGTAAAEEAGRRAYELGHYDEAVETLKAVVTREPDNAPAHHWLTRTYYEMHDADAAVAEGERSVALDPRNSVYRLWLG